MRYYTIDERIWGTPVHQTEDETWVQVVINNRVVGTLRITRSTTDDFLQRLVLRETCIGEFMNLNEQVTYYSYRSLMENLPHPAKVTNGFSIITGREYLDILTEWYEAGTLSEGDRLYQHIYGEAALPELPPQAEVAYQAEEPHQSVEETQMPEPPRQEDNIVPSDFSQTSNNWLPTGRAEGRTPTRPVEYTRNIGVGRVPPGEATLIYDNRDFRPTVDEVEATEIQHDEEVE